MANPKPTGGKRGPKGPRTRGIGTKAGLGPTGKLLKGFLPSQVNDLPVENPPLWNVYLDRKRKPPIVTSGEDILEVAGEYFKWVMENPLYADKIITFQGFASHVPEARKRLMSISGMCAFFGISHGTWYIWRRSRPELASAIADVEEVINRWNVEGAASDMLNANFIARLMGLADRQEVTGKDGGPIAAANAHAIVDLTKLNEKQLAAYHALASALEGDPEGNEEA